MPEDTAPETRYNEAWEANLKRFVDEWAEVSHNKAVAGANFQDQLNSQFLRWADDQHTLLMRTADNNAVDIARGNRNVGVWDNLVFAGALTNPAELAETAIGAKVAEEVKNASKAAMDEALAAIAQTSPAAQGTTGVAQGVLQSQIPVELAQVLTNANTIQTSILAELAKIDQALSDILVHVTGEAVKK